MITREIRVKDGVRFVGEHFSPESSQIIRVLYLVVPETVDGIMWITEGWRPARHSRDLHTDGKAFDIRIHNLIGRTHEERVSLARAWVQKARDSHDNPAYQFEIHGTTAAQFHIHAEYDKR